MSVNEAKEVLRVSGEYFQSKDDLRRIRGRAFDPLLKRACDKLLVYLLFTDRIKNRVAVY